MKGTIMLYQWQNTSCQRRAELWDRGYRGLAEETGKIQMAQGTQVDPWDLIGLLVGPGHLLDASIINQYRMRSQSIVKQSESHRKSDPTLLWYHIIVLSGGTHTKD